MSNLRGRGGRHRGLLVKNKIFNGGHNPLVNVSRKRFFHPKMGKTAKVAVCGMKGVGKTAILEQVIYGSVDKSTEFQPTIEDIYVANVETDRGTREKVRFYDTEGLTGGREQTQLARQCIGPADGYVLVYDTDRPESLDVLVTFKKEIDRNRDKKEVSVVVLGNATKAKEAGSLESTASKAAHWALREKIRHYEVSAMDRSTLYEPFIYLLSKLNPPPNKSSFPQLSMVRKSMTRPDNY